MAVESRCRFHPRRPGNDGAGSLRRAGNPVDSVLEPSERQVEEGVIRRAEYPAPFLRLLWHGNPCGSWSCATSAKDRSRPMTKHISTHVPCMRESSKALPETARNAG